MLIARIQKTINLTKGHSIAMKTKTIVLWGREDLLSTSVELFLTTQKGWKVVNIPNEESLDVLSSTVDKLNPDVVIIQQDDLVCNLNLPAMLLQNHPGLRVITVSPHDNRMEVYSKQDILVTSASDLLSVVKARSVIKTSDGKKRNDPIQ